MRNILGICVVLFFAFLGTLPWWLRASVEIDLTPIEISQINVQSSPKAVYTRPQFVPHTPRKLSPSTDEPQIDFLDFEQFLEEEILEEEDLFTEDYADVSVSVRVVTDRGEPIPGADVMVKCERFGFSVGTADEDGRVLSMSVGTGQCSVQASRNDGLLKAHTIISIELEPGGEYNLQLTLPHRQTGGIGIAIGTHELGIEVLHVLENAPAWQAGLESGDIIVEVEGVSVSSMSESEFVAAMTGAEGSDVEFTLSFLTDEGWVEETHQVTRQVLE